MNTERKNKEKRVRFALYAERSTLDLVEMFYKKDDCGSRSKFIENAIIFYCGYISSNLNGKYLPNVITSTVKSSVEASEERIVRIIFKLAVELAMTMNVVAFDSNISRDSLRKLRSDCIDEVKRVNGSISFEEAYDWQHS